MVRQGDAKVKYWLVAASMAVLSPLHAEEDATGEQTFFADLPVVLTVTRLPQSKDELPSAVTVIDREMIEASGAVELTDLFRLVAGFQIGHYHDVDGPRIAVTYHGNTDQYSRRMQVLIDGRSVYTWGTGGAEWTDLPISIDDIERIEVSRGPNGVTYGSNAFLGVINIITYHSADQTGSYARTTFDDDEYRELVLRHGGRSDDFAYRLTGRYKADNGFEDYTSPNGKLYELNDDSQTSALTFRGDYRGGVNDYWTMQLGGASGPRQVGYYADPLDPVRDRKHTTHYQQLQWKHIIDSDSEVNAQFYHNVHNAEDRFDTALLSEIYNRLYAKSCLGATPPPECSLYPFDAADIQLLLGVDDQTLPRNTSIKSERYELELTHRFRLSEAARMVWGGALREDIVTAADLFDTGGERQLSLSRIFFNLEWKPSENWVVNLGDMLESSNLTDNLHSPRLAINRLFGKGGYVRASAGRAYRIPTAFEEYGDFTIRYADGSLFHALYRSPADIQPERIDSRELAVGVEKPKTGFEVKIFSEEIGDEISAVNDRSPAIPQPFWTIGTVGHTKVNGVELQLRAKMEKALMSVAYANTRASGERISEINPLLTNKVEDAVPLHTVNVLLSYNIAAGLSASASYYYISPMKFYSGDLTEGVRLTDVNINKKYKLFSQEATVSLLLKNLQGAYFDFEEETVSKRTVYLTLKINL